jgi:hypothetical protein
MMPRHAVSRQRAGTARLRPADLARLAVVGMRTRKLRAALSALGIGVGVAAIVAVLGLSRSAQAGLINEINALGTNLLTVTNGHDLTGGTAELPLSAPAMISRLPGIDQVQSTGTVSSASAYRSPLIPAIDTNAISVDAATLGLPATAGTSLVQGSYLNAATAREPAPCSAPRPLSGWASTRSGAGSGSGSAASGSTWPGSSSPPSLPRPSTPPCWSATPPPSTT